jgi:hypothetical protein
MSIMVATATHPKLCSNNKINIENNVSSITKNGSEETQKFSTTKPEPTSPPKSNAPPKMFI